MILKVDNYRTAYKEALIGYTQKRKKATVQELHEAIGRDESVAEKEQQYLVDIDYSDFYNLGYVYSRLGNEEDQYRQWVKDWGLEDPTPGTRSDKDMFKYSNYTEV